MAASLIRCYQGQPGTTETTAYTVPVGKTLLLTAIRITNTTGSTATASVSAVPVSGTASAANRLIAATAVNAYDIVSDTDPHVLTAGQFLSVQASVTGVTFTISGALL